MTRQWLSAVFALLAVSCSPENEIRTKAMWLCAEGQLKPDIEFVPEGADLSKYVRTADVEFLREAAKEDENADASGFGALGAVMAASMKPGIRAMREAQNSMRKCEVIAVELGENSATARLNVTEPELEGGLEIIKKVGDLAAIETSAERVKKAKAWYADSPTKTKEEALQFVKTEDGWVANLQLPEEAANKKAEEEEKARLEEQRKQAEALRTEALDLYELRKFEDAKSKLQEAAKLAPDNEDITKDLEEIEKTIANLIGGAWEVRSEKDPMTDDENVVVVLYANEPIGSGFTAETPTLIVRCRRGSFEIYLNTTEYLDSDWRSRRTKIRTRFGSDEPKTRRLSVSTGKSAVFFGDDFAEELAAHDGEKFVVEFSTPSRGHITTFTLTAAKQAIERARTSCGT